MSIRAIAFETSATLHRAHGASSGGRQTARGRKSDPVEMRERKITELMQHHLDEAAEKKVEALLRQTHGTNLTRLKVLLDAGNDRHDLQKLIFSDIDDPGRRARLLRHIEAEAKQQPEHLRIASDIDNTAVASRADPNYPRRQRYPGFKALIRALSPHPPIMITARPQIIERRTHQLLRSAGLERSPVASGDVSSGHDAEKIAAEKVRDFKQYNALYPEGQFLWFGDDTQGDVIAAKVMLDDDEHPAKLALIHVVTGELKEPERPDVRFFHTFAGAAQILADGGLISEADVARVKREAAREFAAIEFETPEQRENAANELRADGVEIV